MDIDEDGVMCRSPVDLVFVVIMISLHAYHCHKVPLLVVMAFVRRAQHFRFDVAAVAVAGWERFLQRSRVHPVMACHGNISGWTIRELSAHHLSRSPLKRGQGNIPGWAALCDSSMSHILIKIHSAAPISAGIHRVDNHPYHHKILS